MAPKKKREIKQKEKEQIIPVRQSTRNVGRDRPNYKDIPLKKNEFELSSESSYDESESSEQDGNKRSKTEEEGKEGEFGGEANKK